MFVVYIHWQRFIAQFLYCGKETKVFSFYTGTSTTTQPTYLSSQYAKSEHEREDEFVLLEQAPAHIFVYTLGEVRVKSFKTDGKVVALLRVYNRLVVQIYKPEMT